MDLETEPFTASGKPLLVIAGARRSGASGTALTVTINGAPMQHITDWRRTGNQNGAYIAIAPAGGPTTIRLTTEESCSNAYITVIEVDGVQEVGAVGDQKTTPTSPLPNNLTPSVATTVADSIVFYALNKLDPSTSGEIAVDGAALLAEIVTTPGGSTSDTHTVIAWARAREVRRHEATIAWGTPYAAAARAFELLSVAP